MDQLEGMTCHILIEFGIPMNLVRLIKICLKETYYTVRVAKHLSDIFPIKRGFEARRCFVASAFQLCFGLCH